MLSQNYGAYFQLQLVKKIMRELVIYILPSLGRLLYAFWQEIKKKKTNLDTDTAVNWGSRWSSWQTRPVFWFALLSCFQEGRSLDNIFK